MDTVLNQPVFQISVCAQHDQLLTRYQKALEAWARLREEAWHMGLRGKQLNGELLRLQREFSRSYALLHKHSRECLLCKCAEKLTARDCDTPQLARCSANPD